MDYSIGYRRTSFMVLNSSKNTQEGLTRKSVSMQGNSQREFLNNAPLRYYDYYFLQPEENTQ